MRRLLAFLIVAGLGCGGAPRRGGAAAEALLDARIAVAADPGDVRARARLVDLELGSGNRGAALGQLLAIERIGGPLGARLSASHRRLLGELLRERGQARLLRGSGAAHGDLRRAMALGAEVAPDELWLAERSEIVLALRHADDRVRAGGRAQLERLAKRSGASPELIALAAGLAADADEPARLRTAGALWDMGARRAAVEVLTVDGRRLELRPSAPWRDDLEAWWTGLRVPASGPGGTVCVERGLEAMLPSAHDARGWTAAVRACLEATHSLGVDVAGVAPAVRPALLRALGRSADADAAVQLAVTSSPPAEQPGLALVAAAESALAGQASETTRRLLAGAHDVPGAALARIVLPPAEPLAAVDVAQLAAARATWRSEQGYLNDALLLVARKFARDPADGEGAAEALLARDVDRAAVLAGLGALYDELGDPARARVAWQAAVDDDPAPAYVLGLAQAAASARDPDAALVHLTTAAAASGDPAVPMILVARALLAADAPTHAIEVLRSAIELAGADDLEVAVRLAAEASRVAGRDAQADALLASYGFTSTHGDAAVEAALAADPTDAPAALRSGEPARLSVAARWHARSAAGVALRAALLERTAPEDPRHALALAELSQLVLGDAPSLLADAAARVLRRLSPPR